MKKLLLLLIAVVALWTAGITSANNLQSIIDGCNNQTIWYWKSGACYLNDGSGYYTFEKRMESYKIDKKVSEIQEIENMYLDKKEVLNRLKKIIKNEENKNNYSNRVIEKRRRNKKKMYSF